MGSSDSSGNSSVCSKNDQEAVISDATCTTSTECCKCVEDSIM